MAQQPLWTIQPRCGRYASPASSSQRGDQPPNLANLNDLYQIDPALSIIKYWASNSVGPKNAVRACQGRRLGRPTRPLGLRACRSSPVPAPILSTTVPIQSHATDTNRQPSPSNRRQGLPATLPR